MPNKTNMSIIKHDIIDYLNQEKIELKHVDYTHKSNKVGAPDGWIKQLPTGETVITLEVVDAEKYKKYLEEKERLRDEK